VRLLYALFALSLCLPANAEDKWVYVKSGPFEVWTNGPDKQAKLRLLEAEQFRHALTNLLGKQELKIIWPIRILAVKDKRATIKPLTLVRDTYLTVIPNEQPLGPDFRRAAARLFLDANTKRYPQTLDQGIEEVLSALEVNGTHIYLGAPPADKRTPGWAKIHMMLTSDFAARSRVYLSNLEQGSDEGTASRNAFDKSPAEIEQMVKAHAAKTTYELKPLPGKSISIEREYYSKSLPSDQARIAEVDAAMTKAASLSDLQTPEAFETQEQYEKAITAGSKSARAWFQRAIQLRDAKTTDQARAAFKKAAELNPLWGAPHAELAKLEAAVPVRSYLEWKQAATLEVRNVEYWRAYAVSATEANQFTEAAKAWSGAERAAPTDKERAELKQARLDLEAKRAEFASAERRKASEEREREIARLKAEAMAEIRKAEAKANDRLGPVEGVERAKAEKWWDGPAGEKATGQLTQVDCLAGGVARLVVTTAPGKIQKLVIRDSKKITVIDLTNSNESSFGCGPQKPPRAVVVTYQPKADAKLGTAGDVLQVEFR
jgi:hypothetical protein